MSEVPEQLAWTSAVRRRRCRNRNLTVPVVYLGELTIAVIGAEGGADE